MKKGVLLIVLVAVLFGLLLALLLAVGGEGDMPTSKIYGETAGGVIKGRDLNFYFLARDTSTSCEVGTTTAFIGQSWDFTFFNIWRAYLSFDTSEIPDDAIIKSARLYISAHGDFSDTDFLVQVYRYAWAEALCSNREANYDGAYGGSATLEGTLRDTADGWVSGTFYNLAVATAGINKTGDTKYALVSKEDVDNSEPAGSEYVDIRTAEYAGTTSDPYLLIEWVLPGERPRSRHKLLVLDAPYALIETWEDQLKLTKERFGLGTFEITVPEDYTMAAALVQYNRVLIVRGDGDWDNQAPRLWGKILDIKRFYAEDAGPDVGGSGKGAAFVTALGVTYTDYFLNSRCYPIPDPIDLTPDGDGTYTQWAGDFTDIDDHPDSHDGDATYISSSTINKIETVTLSDYANPGAVIKGIRFRVIARSAEQLTGQQVSPFKAYAVLLVSGDSLVQRVPTGNGTHTDWFGDYQEVDDPVDVPDDDATYILSSDTNDKESYTFETIDLTANALATKVTLTYRARESAEHYRVKGFLLINGTEYYGDELELTGSYVWQDDEWETNPANGEPWTIDAINALEMGVQTTLHAPAPGNARVTCMYLSVEYVYVYELDPINSLTYTERYVDIAKSPTTGVAWTEAGVDALQVGVMLRLGTPVRVTSIGVRVYHGPIQLEDHIDDVLKAWVDANLGAGADADRRVTGFTDEADEDAGASATYEIGYNLLLQRFLELCKLHDVGMDIVGTWAGGATRLDASPSYEFQTTVPEGVNRTHSQGVNTPVVISRGRGIVRMLDYELDVVSARNVVYALGERDGLAQAIQEVPGDGPALAKQDYGLLLKQDGWPILLSHIPGRYRREAVLDVEGADDTTQLTSQADKFLGDEGAELEMVQYEHSAAAIYVPLEDFVPGDLLTFYDAKLSIGPLQPKVEMISCAIGGDGVERYEVQLGVVKRPALSLDAAFRAVGKRRTLYIKSS